MPLYNTTAVLGDLSANVAFSGDITPAQITATVTDYNPTGLSTASTLRLSSNAVHLVTGLAGGADGRLMVLMNVGTFDLLLLSESGGSTAANRFTLPATTNLKPNESMVLQYDGTSSRWRPIAGVPDTPPSVVLDRFYVATFGSDSNDGRSWKSAMLTPAAAVTAANGSGDIYFGPGTFAWADTITLSQSVRLHGASWQSAAGTGTEWVWSGANDGRAGLITAANAAADWTKGLIEDIRFSGNATTGGGGAALSLRQIQNGSVLRNVHVTNWKTGPCFKLWDSTATGVNQPGYVRFDNCWAGGGTYGWWIEAGTTPLLFNLCSSDPNAETLYPWYIRNKDHSDPVTAITACSQSGATATYTATAHGIDAGRLLHITGVTPAGYNGLYRTASIPDANTFTVTLDTTGLGAGSAFGQVQQKAGGGRGESIFIACKTEYSSDVDVPTFLIEGNQRVVLIGVSARKGTLGTKPFVQWDGPLLDEHGQNLMVPPITMEGCQAQNLPSALIAPRFGGDNVDFTVALDGVSGDGRAVPVNFIPRAAAPLLDIRQMGTPAVTPPSGTRRLFVDAASGELSVRTASGTTVSLEASAGGGAPTGAQYLTLATDATLTAERVFTPGTGLDITDAGAGGALTLDIDTSEFTPETVLDRFADTLVVRDASAVAERKVLLRNLENLRTGFSAYDELVTGVAPGANTLMSGGLSMNAATGTFSLIAGTQNHPGIARASTGASATGRCGFLSGSTAIRFGGAEVYFVTTIMTEANLSSAGERYCILAGFGDNFASADATDGVYLRYEDDLNGGKWEARCVTNSVATLADTGITVAASTWYTLEIFVNAAANSATFYIDGTLVATTTTNIPTAAGRETGIELGILKTVGTAARTLDIDSYGYLFQFTTAR